MPATATAAGISIGNTGYYTSKIRRPEDEGMQRIISAAPKLTVVYKNSHFEAPVLHPAVGLASTVIKEQNGIPRKDVAIDDYKERLLALRDREEFGGPLTWIMVADAAIAATSIHPQLQLTARREIRQEVLPGRFRATCSDFQIAQ